MPIFYYDTSFGRLAIAETNSYISHIFFEGRGDNSTFELKETPVLKEAARQLEQYFKGELKEFDLPLAPNGTIFMKSVWDKLMEIPYGETASYKDIAVKIENPKGARAVGLANNKNPIPFVIPCHRVIGANGKMVGYAGGLDIKTRLLELERTHAK